MLQSSHGDVDHSIGHTVGNIVVTRYGARWVLEAAEGTTLKVHDVFCHDAVHLKLIQSHAECEP